MRSHACRLASELPRAACLSGTSRHSGQTGHGGRNSAPMGGGVRKKKAPNGGPWESKVKVRLKGSSVRRWQGRQRGGRAPQVAPHVGNKVSRSWQRFGRVVQSGRGPVAKREAPREVHGQVCVRLFVYEVLRYWYRREEAPRRPAKRAKVDWATHGDGFPASYAAGGARRTPAAGCAWHASRA